MPLLHSAPRARTVFPCVLKPEHVADLFEHRRKAMLATGIAVAGKGTIRGHGGAGQAIEHSAFKPGHGAGDITRQGLAKGGKDWLNLFDKRLVRQVRIRQRALQIRQQVLCVRC
ncbi:hypothetical protein GCM10011415_13350 [Salipiger pallidus]|uniref:Uncharacterized protein n=1 Tax=Salipiger pallidus TaxID=1775170 RepID=A0A8J2ZIU9_9RHOB|nr:hypothetical protein GCM10011415_13350 [Salipiger pallidus]